MIEVTAAIPGAAAGQPCATHCSRASSIGSNARGLRRTTVRLLAAGIVSASSARYRTGHGSWHGPHIVGCTTIVNPMKRAATPAGLHRPVHPVRIVTAASLFDGHDAAINLIRLGHNRSVAEVVAAAVAEDVQGVAVSSYQGGHVEYFKYLVDCLRDAGRGDVLVYGGGGGVIVPAEIAELEAYGVRKIFSPDDGQRLGLARMVNLLVEECDRDLASSPPRLADLYLGDQLALARTITALEQGRLDEAARAEIAAAARRRHVPVLGVSGSTSATSCASRCSRSTRLADAVAARCSATASA